MDGFEDWKWLEDASVEYSRVVHPPLVLLLCISGLVGHTISIATLSSMQNPTNMFLISMSCSQLALCINFLYSTFFKWMSDELCQPFFFSSYMARTMHVSVTLSVLVHMSGVFHVVALSIIRYKSLSQLSGPNSNVPWFTYKKCRLIIAIIYISVTALCIPLYFTSEVKEVAENEGCAERFPHLKSQKAYQLSFSSLPYLHVLNFWLFHLCSKIVPAIILCLMTLFILDQLKRIRLISARFASVERDKQHQMTTKMILIIMIIFIVVELPQGVLAVVSTISEIQLIHEIGDITEMLTLFTSCTIFALFCLMNSRIRSALNDAPCIKAARKLCNFTNRSLRPSTGVEHNTIIIANCGVDKEAQLALL